MLLCDFCYLAFYIFADPASEYPSRRRISIIDKIGLQAYSLLIIMEVMNYLFVNGNEIQAYKLGSYTYHELNTVRKMESLIVENLHNAQLSVQDIAKQICLSRIQCTKLFNKVEGLSPRQYITALRLTEAKKLLVNTKLTVEAISRKTGFSSLSHFSRQFKRWTGISPLKYRIKPYQIL